MERSAHRGVFSSSGSGILGEASVSPSGKGRTQKMSTVSWTGSPGRQCGDPPSAGTGGESLQGRAPRADCEPHSWKKQGQDRSLGWSWAGRRCPLWASCPRGHWEGELEMLPVIYSRLSSVTPGDITKEPLDPLKWNENRNKNNWPKGKQREEEKRNMKQLGETESTQ